MDEKVDKGTVSAQFTIRSESDQSNGVASASGTGPSGGKRGDCAVKK